MAKRFRFNLDPVLRYREILEDQRRREFAEAARAADEETRRREDLARERSEVQEDILRLYKEQAPVQSVISSFHMVGSLDTAMAQSMVRQRQLDAAREQTRLRLVKARQDSKIMETLKERRKEEHYREEDRIEQNLLDELAIQARFRRERERREAGEGGE